MIGEIPITRSEMEEIGAEIRACIRDLGLPQTIDILDSDYPCVFLVFLTAFGAYNTERDYWGALGDEIGAAREHLFNHRWHRRYLDKVKRRGLRYFEEKESSTPYVTTIRYHGGIPVYSLADYFRVFVLPAVDRPELAEVSTRQALDALLKSAYNVDAPVINFLENSGALGEEFFEACCKLARHYRQRQEILPASDVDLPERVIQAFEDFVQEELLPVEEGARLRLRKPRLLFTPLYEQAHLYVYLPEQEIPLRYADGALEWRIQLPGSQENLRRPCKVRMQRQRMVIEEVYLPLNAAPASALVGLVFIPDDGSGEALLKRWLLPLMLAGEVDQVIAFRADGAALRPGDPLPAEEILLVYPADVELIVEGALQPSRLFGALDGAWAGWQAHGWDLSQAWAVQMQRGGQMVGMPLPVAGKLPLPELCGEPFAHNVDPSGTPLYIGFVPTLRIPLRPDLPLERELRRWRLDLRSSWSAQPELKENIPFTRIRENISVEDGWAYISLEQFLGSEPVGTYLLTLSSPAEDEIEFRFRLWPKLTLVGVKKALLPGAGGADPQTLTLILPGQALCEAQSGAEGVEATSKIYGWEVTVAPEAVRADLNLVWKREGGEPVRVPLYIPVPRLRWALTLDQDQGQLQWATRLIQRPLDIVLQSASGALHVSMPGLDQAQYLALDLVEVEDEDRVRQTVMFRKTPFAPDWQRVSFEILRDTLKRSESLARLDLIYQPSRSEETVRIPLLLLSRRLEVSDVDLQSVGELRWRLTWNQRYQVRNRRVLLQPAWQPWQEAWEFGIPDQGKNQLILSSMGLISARYQVHFYTATPDEPALQAIPPQREVAIVDLCTPDERLAELAAQESDAIAKHNYETSFRAALETACIHEDLNQPQQRDLKLSELAKSIVHISSLPLLLGFFRWLDNHQIQSPYNSFFRKYMFKPELVRQVLARYRKEHPDLRAYLAYVPIVRDIYAESARMIAQHSDTPAVLSACLSRLLQQEDDGLAQLIVELISAARLSNQDAVDLLARKPAWASKALAALPVSPAVDQLLADFLVKAGNKQLDLTGAEDQSLLLRTLPYVKDAPSRRPFVKDLLEASCQEVYPVLMRAQEAQQIQVEELEQLLALKPKWALKLLGDLPESKTRQTLREHLTQQFPAAAGIISPGNHLKTRAGIAKLLTIKTGDERELQSAHLRQSNIRLMLEVGEGVLKEKFILDCSTLTMRFVNAPIIFACGHCDFVSPSRKVIDRHHRDCHPYESLQIGTSQKQISVDLNEIEIIES